jgi:hypothetical protein
VFLVVTDDPAWARRHITGPDVTYSLALDAFSTSDNCSTESEDNAVV